MKRSAELLCAATSLFLLAASPARAASTSPPFAPTNVAATITGRNTLTLSWANPADNATGFIPAYRIGTSGSFYALTSLLPTNGLSLPLLNLAEATTYQFFVQVQNSAGSSNSAITTVTMPGITSRGYHPAVVGQSFNYTLTASSDGGAADSFNLTGSLPQGLTYNPGTHQVTGTPTTGGVYTATLAAHYPAWGDYTKSLTLRVIYPSGPPVVTASLPRQTLTPGGSALTVPLTGFFTDRDTEKAVRFSTTKGTFDMALYATATPQTVSNFLNYVTDGDYTNSIVHRSVPGFIIQGGGFKPVAPNFIKVPTDPSPTNEPGVSNVRGTVAMAKLGSDPNSATSQWFISLADNAANLDDQNGGFTAFGRVCGTGMNVADAIASLPRNSYTVSVDGQPATLSDWPMDTTPPAPPTMDQSKLVLVNSATRIEPLVFAVTGNTVPGIVAPTINGTNLVLASTSAFGGMTTLTITATDLDGNTVSQPVTVEVASAYTAWINLHALQDADSTPGADKDADLLSNGVEFALMGSPSVADAASVRPQGVLMTDNNQRYAALSFKLRKDLAGATVIIEGNGNLAAGTWPTVWTSADISGPQVLQLVDRGDHYEIIVRDNTSLTTPTTSRFLRVKVQVPD